MCTLQRLRTYIRTAGHYEMQGRKGKVWQALTVDIHSQYNTHLSEENMGRAMRGRAVGQSILLRHTHPIPKPKSFPPSYRPGSTPSFPYSPLHGPASHFCLQVFSPNFDYENWVGGQASHKAGSYSTDMQCHVLHSPLVCEGTSIIASPQT